MLDLLLTEDLLDHLTKHFGDYVPLDQIQLAVQDPRNAMKLVYGLYKGVINSVDEPGALEKVAPLKPMSPEKEQKQENKSEQEIEFERRKAKAREVSPKYWQWILQLWATDPNVQIDASVFDYLDAHELTPDNLKDKTYQEVAEASRTWHEEEFANQKVGGTYKRGPDDPDSFQVGDYAWVPVFEQDARLEGSKMQNCIGRYCVPGNDTRIYSLRNKFNNPHVSLSVKKHGSEWAVSEIKGKQNKAPIAKYTKYVLPMVDQLLESGAKIASHTDFWRMVPRDQIEKYLPYAEDVMSALRNVKISAEELSVGMADQLLIKFSNAFKRHEDEYDALMKRASPRAVTKAIQQGASVDFVLSAIKNRKITEQDADNFLANSNLRRSGKLLLLSSYHPEDFVLQLEAAHPEDILEAWQNYEDAIEAFQGTAPVFAELLRSGLAVHKATNNWQVANILKVLATKTPAEMLVKMMRAEDGSVLVPDTLRGSVLAHPELPVDLKLGAAADVQPPGMHSYQTDSNSDKTRDWIYSLSPDGLREVLRLGPKIGAPANTIQLARNLLMFLGELEYEAEEIGAEDYAQLAEEYDTPEELTDLLNRIPRKGPGPLLRLRRYLERKIARLERLQDVTEEPTHV